MGSVRSSEWQGRSTQREPRTPVHRALKASARMRPTKRAFLRKITRRSEGRVRAPCSKYRCRCRSGCNSCCRYWPSLLLWLSRRRRLFVAERGATAPGLHPIVVYLEKAVACARRPYKDEISRAPSFAQLFFRLRSFCRVLFV